jgi:hypothetical protein
MESILGYVATRLFNGRFEVIFARRSHGKPIEPDRFDSTLLVEYRARIKAALSEQDDARDVTGDAH